MCICQATAHEDLKRLLGKAQAIDEVESTIPRFIEKLMPHNYPAFVHVLRVSAWRHRLPWDLANRTCTGCRQRRPGWHQRQAPLASCWLPRSSCSGLQTAAMLLCGGRSAYSLSCMCIMSGFGSAAIRNRVRLVLARCGLLCW